MLHLIENAPILMWAPKHNLLSNQILYASAEGRVPHKKGAYAVYQIHSIWPLLQALSSMSVSRLQVESWFVDICLLC